ncbi:MAG TPA: ATP-binding protein, partial [Bacteroidia bacterium]|nr:ATP-binding protein [Bacteroidia bacterium]
YEKLLNKNITTVFNDNVNVIEKFFAIPPGKVSSIKYSVSGRELNLIVHSTSDCLIIEVEPIYPDTTNSDLVDLSGDFVAAMEETQTLKELCDLVAVSIKRVTGYDRVMVYRFDENYNGEVLSESKNEELESFLGLHYPHTDIPAQARQLYIKNQLRIIVDVNYTPVPVYTTANVGNEALDLSLSVLRSVSPIHIQYLQNMGVGATLTISLLLRGKLWGLIACHHYSSRYLPYDVRMSAKLLGHFITSQIDTRKLNEEYDLMNRLNNAVEHFSSKKVSFNRESLIEIVNDPAILSVCNADGVAVYVNSSVYKFGKTPSDQSIEKIATHFQDAVSYSTQSVLKNVPELSSYLEELPGINFFSLRKNTGDCVIWFRQESTHNINWAGDPNKSIEKDKNGLSPRKSFELYCETVKNHSKVWLESELNASANFVNILERHIHSILLTEEEEKQRLLANTLIQTNAELENINYISTHDLQEPLRKIQMTASVLLNSKNENLSEDTVDKVAKMNQFAGRMQLLIKDILKYTQLNYGTAAFEYIQLKELLQNLKLEMYETITEKQASLFIAELPKINGVTFLIKQLFTNLINNSIKFSDPSRPCEISISVNDDKQVLPIELKLPLSEYHVIKYSDNGIGFHEADNEKIFKIFTRLGNSQKVVGSGIGLAICRKIMQTHNGYIFAEGKVNEGATFRIFFPKKLMETLN